MKSSVTPIVERCPPITPNIVFCCLVIVVAIITTTRRNCDINHYIVNALFSLKRMNYYKLFSCTLINIDILRLVVKLNRMCSL